MNAVADKDQAALPPRPPWLSHYPRTVDWLLDIPVRPVHALIDDAVETFPENPFLDFFGKQYTYVRAARFIARTAAGLQELGVGKGTKVGLFLPNSLYSVVCYYAIFKAGGTVVMIRSAPSDSSFVRLRIPRPKS